MAVRNSMRIRKSVMLPSGAMALMLNEKEGAGLDLEELQQLHVLDDWYPLHDRAAKRRLRRVWMQCAMWPWHQPLPAIRSLFGERVAFYFAFLGFYAASLVLLAAVGIVAFVHQVLNRDPRIPWLIFLGIFASLWASLFTEAWKRRASYLALQWGVLDMGETVKAHGTLAANADLDADEGHFHTVTISGASAYSLTPKNTTAHGYTAITVRLTTAATASGWSWGGTINWAGGTAPDLSRSGRCADGVAAGRGQ
jgi:hypothetical protein